MQNCSVIHGSKNGGFLYTVYNNELVDMPDLMHKPSIFEEITGEKTIINKNIKHDVSQFVDDLTYSIGAG